jgi:excisionase family DNA binding protein
MSKPTPQGVPPVSLRLLVESKAVCEALSISRRKLGDLTRVEAIPSHRIGRSVRYAPTELQAWIDAGCPTDPGAADRIRKPVTP